MSAQALGNSVVLCVLLCISSTATAKRSAPADVAPVTIGNIEFRAPHFPLSTMGYVEAHDSQSGELLWSRQLYVVVKDPALEGDVQDVFITSMVRDGDALLIENERGSQFRLDVSSLEVKTIKGSVRIETKHTGN